MNDLKMKIIQEMFSHKEQPDSYIADQILALIQQEIQGCLPEENSEYQPPTFTTAKKILPEEFVKGHNACRQDIITNLKAKGLTN